MSPKKLPISIAPESIRGTVADGGDLIHDQVTSNSNPVSVQLPDLPLVLDTLK